MSLQPAPFFSLSLQHRSYILDHQMGSWCSLPRTVIVIIILFASTPPLLTKYPMVWKTFSSDGKLMVTHIVHVSMVFLELHYTLNLRL